MLGLPPGDTDTKSKDPETKDFFKRFDEPIEDKEPPPEVEAEKNQQESGKDYFGGEEQDRLSDEEIEHIKTMNKRASTLISQMISRVIGMMIAFLIAQNTRVQRYMFSEKAVEEMGKYIMEMMPQDRKIMSNSMGLIMLIAQESTQSITTAFFDRKAQKRQEEQQQKAQETHTKQDNTATDTEESSQDTDTDNGETGFVSEREKTNATEPNSLQDFG